MAVTSAPDARAGPAPAPWWPRRGQFAGIWLARAALIRLRGVNVLWTCAGAAALLWPALWNGYPILFADTGTYLSQAMRLYVGWDRPPVYSVLLRMLHWDRSLWPPVIAQALLVAATVRLTLAAFAPRWPPWMTGAACGLLSVLTAAGTVASRLLPDVFAGVIVVLLLAILRPEAALSRRAMAACAAAAGVMIATHQSYLPLSLALLAAAAACSPWRRVLLAVSAPALAAMLLIGINTAAFGRASLSPFGAVFLLARALEDGPARDVLERDCPASGWRLCGRALPRTADEFLWRPGALADAGGAKAVAAEASAIVTRAWTTEPAAMIRAFAANAARQVVTVDADDGLEDWAEAAPALARFPPAQADAFYTSRQAAGVLALPVAMRDAQTAVALASLATLIWRARRRQALAVLILVALATNAAVTGGLSGPHARYASRIVWLAPLFAVLPRPRPAAAA